MNISPTCSSLKCEFLKNKYDIYKKTFFIFMIGIRFCLSLSQFTYLDLLPNKIIIFNLIKNPTSDDNGDVLTVVEGAWGKAAPSGGGSGVLVVTATEDADTGVLTLDKTASEIYSAMKSGGVMVDAEDASYGIFPFVWSFYLSTGAYNFYAITISPVDGSVEGTFRFQALTGADYPSYTPSN